MTGCESPEEIRQLVLHYMKPMHKLSFAMQAAAGQGKTFLAPMAMEDAKSLFESMQFFSSFQWFPEKLPPVKVTVTRPSPG